MDVSSTAWLYELEMENSDLISQCEIDLGDHSLDEFIFNCFSPEAHSSYTSLNLNIESSTHIEASQTVAELEVEELKTNNNGSSQCSLSNNDNVISFSNNGSSPSSTHLPQQLSGNTNCIGNPKHDDDDDGEMMIFQENCKRTKRVRSTSSTRGPLRGQSHILAERKRREKLNQSLISLSTLIPGLKKMDKASILEDTIKYIKELRERVQTLEKEDKKNLVEPTTVFSVNRSRPSVDDNDTVLSKENFGENFKQSSPELEIRLSYNNVLIRIHCEKHSGGSGGVLAKILSEMQALHLNVTSTIVVPFGDAALDITVIAQMDDGFHMTAKNLVENVRLAVVKFL